MSDPADILFKVYVFLKPHSLDKLIYRTLDAAQRACTSEDGEIEEWIAPAAPADTDMGASAIGRVRERGYTGDLTFVSIKSTVLWAQPAR